MEAPSTAHDAPIVDGDVIIPVIGMTGAGKSTFISLCSGEPNTTAGHDLFSCTSRVAVHSVTFGGRTIHLIDTPGFDDTGRGDGETLQEIAYWLSMAYEHKIHISGLIYLHRITDPRLYGSGLRALTCFKKICGVENYAGIVLATTGWDTVQPNQMALASDRHNELCKRDEFWRDICKGGGQAVAISAAKADALKILGHILGKDRKLTLAFQRQLADGRSLHQTDAGRIVYDAAAEQLDDLRDQLVEAEQAMRKSISVLDEKKSEELGEFAAQVTNSVAPFEESITRLRTNVAQLRESWEAKAQRDFEQIQWEISENERRLREREEHLALLQRDVAHTAESTVTPFLEDEIEELREKRDTLYIRKQQRIDGRSSGKAKMALSVVGTGLAIGQLVAALACTIM